MSDERAIVGEGTPESAWQRWDVREHVPARTFGEIVPPHARLVFVAPHPDDEILGAAGLMLEARHAGRPCLIVAVTDGEASHPGSTFHRVEHLGALRREESERALECLGVQADVVRFALPDGRVREHEADLLARIAEVIRPDDVVVTTWEMDGHPDHEATGRAARAAVAVVGARLLAVPIWTWHWASAGDPRVPWDRALRLELSPGGAAAKADALLEHRSQLEPDPTTGRGPVVPRWARERLLRRFEVFFT